MKNIHPSKIIHKLSIFAFKSHYWGFSHHCTFSFPCKPHCLDCVSEPYRCKYWHCSNFPAGSDKPPNCSEPLYLTNFQWWHVHSCKWPSLKYQSNNMHRPSSCRECHCVCTSSTFPRMWCIPNTFQGSLVRRIC